MYFLRIRTGWLKLTVVCVILILGSTGCWNRRELDTLGIVMGVAVDKVEESGKVQLTAQIVKPAELGKSKEGGSSAAKPYLNIKNTGDTVLDTVRGFLQKFSQKLYFQHNQVVIFSHEAAQEGVRQFIDFFLRDNENRLTVWVLVAQNAAGEILEVKPQFENIPAVDISEMLQAQVFTSRSKPVKLTEFLTRLMSKTTVPVAPIIGVTGSGSDQTVQLSGTAIFKKDKMTGQFDAEETRSLLWVLGEVKSGIIVVDCPGGDGKESLEITRAGSKITPEIKNGQIHIKINIKEEGNLGSQTCSEDLSSPEAAKAMEKKEGAIIEKEILAALKKAQTLNADVFGFGDAINRKYPKQWHELESKWDELFPHIQAELKVEAKIRRTGRITKPAKPERE